MSVRVRVRVRVRVTSPMATRCSSPPLSSWSCLPPIVVRVRVS